MARITEVRAVRPGCEHKYNNDEAKCWVYRVYDSRKRLAYVGIAYDFARRWRQHVENSWWLGEIRVTWIEVYGYSSRVEARMEEAAAIHGESPVYNTMREDRWHRRYTQFWESEDVYRPVAKRRFIGVT